MGLSKKSHVAAKKKSLKQFFFLSHSKRAFLTYLFLIGAVALFYSWVIFFALKIELPSLERPLVLYSNQTRQDIKRTYLKAIEAADNSVFLSIYSLTDLDVLSLIHQKSKQDVRIKIEYDPSASLALNRYLEEGCLVPIRSKGLMHRKILTLDDTSVFLGSANLTPSSLRHHNNLVIGIYDPSLATFLQHPSSSSFFFSLSNGVEGKIYLLPERQLLGLHHLLSEIDHAKKSIKIAMFTLTHPMIQEALIAAKKRGIKIKVAIDYFTAKGASKKTIQALERANIPLFFSQGKELLHHKWAWIDDQILITGSANWTRSAFLKNEDFLLFLSGLPKKQIKFLNELWTIIETESQTVLK